MKKLMLIAAGALFIGGVASYAQDTTGTYRSKQQIDQTRTRTTTTTDKSDHSMKSGQDMKSDQIKPVLEKGVDLETVYP
jgi:hypothetical protein